MLAKIEEIEEVEAEEVTEENDVSIHDRLTPIDAIIPPSWEDEVTPCRPSITHVRPTTQPPKRPVPPPPRPPTSQEVLNHITYVGEAEIVVETNKSDLNTHEMLYARLWEGAKIEGVQDEEIATDWFANPKLRR